MSTVPLAERQQWPKLSETLPCARAPNVCQSCGAGAENLQRWEEGDEWDKPTGVLVVVCVPCEQRLIEVHPRLYRQVDRWQPWPGAMALCVDCRHRDGLECSHPELARNGGRGLVISFPEPIRAFLCGSRSRGLTHIYEGPPTACAGRAVST